MTKSTTEDRNRASRQDEGKPYWEKYVKFDFPPMEAI